MKKEVTIRRGISNGELRGQWAITLSEQVQQILKIKNLNSLEALNQRFLKPKIDHFYK